MIVKYISAEARNFVSRVTALRLTSNSATASESADSIGPLFAAPDYRAVA